MRRNPFSCGCGPVISVVAVLLAVCAVVPPLDASAAPPAQLQPGTVRGTLSSGARYALAVPQRFNGTLLVWSPGYIGGPAGGEASLPDGALAAWLDEQGYAVASSKPTTNGWAVADLLRDQPELVHVARERLGGVSTTIALGNSMGGLTTTALVERHPDLFDGGLAMCASVAGGVNMLNLSLDASFVFKTLLAPNDDALQLVDVTDEAGRQQAAASVLEQAESSATGRARLALAAAVGQVSTWSEAGTPQPAPSDWREQLRQQAAGFLFGVFSPRQPLEQRAGGNFSWNTGVDYAAQLRRSGDLTIVRKAYRAAGLDLSADLRTLAAAPRIVAEESAVSYMQRNAEPTGRLARPLLTVHEIGDNAPVVSQARAYADAARQAGSSAMLAQAFVNRPGHCGYSAAEVAAALTTLQNRIASGSWNSDATAAALNRRAAELSRRSAADLGPSEFISYHPRELIRRDDLPKTGTQMLGDGTPWSYAIPPSWDGRLVIQAGAEQVGQTAPQQWLLGQGVAIAGFVLSSPWNLAADRDHAAATRAAFVSAAGEPTSTILTGRSQGGLVTRIVVDQHPQWLDGAVPMCGGGAGAISMWNTKLDMAFALKHLVNPQTTMKVTGITDVNAETAALDELIQSAGTTPVGQARLVLAAALGRVAAGARWQGLPHASLSDRYAAYAPSMALAIGAFVRAGFEQTVQGVFSWNTGVDYARLLRDSGRLAEVRDAYRQAGGDLDADLAALARAPRLSADPGVVGTVERLASFRGDLRIPVLDLHTTGDPAGPTMDEVAYADTVRSAGAGAMLHQALVDATGHCTFAPIEEITALAAMLDRVEHQAWTVADDPAAYHRLAEQLARSTGLESDNARFVPVVPVVVARPWDYRNWGTYAS